jgi:hypothetical protein
MRSVAASTCGCGRAALRRFAQCDPLVPGAFEHLHRVVPHGRQQRRRVGRAQHVHERVAGGQRRHESGVVVVRRRDDDRIGVPREGIIEQRRGQARQALLGAGSAVDEDARVTSFNEDARPTDVGAAARGVTASSRARVNSAGPGSSTGGLAIASRTARNVRRPGRGFGGRRDGRFKEGRAFGRGAAAVHRHRRADRECAGRGVPHLCRRRRGHALIDRALYLPASWTEDPTTLAMLAHAFLAVATAIERDATPTPPDSSS